MSRYFYGWYFRCQGEEGTAAVIPAVHLSREKQCCSIQVITPGASLYREYPVSDFRIDRKKGIIQIGRNWFSRTGISMEFTGREQENSGFEDELTVRGCLHWSIPGNNAVKKGRQRQYLRLGDWRLRGCVKRFFLRHHGLEVHIQIGRSGIPEVKAGGGTTRPR